MEKKFYSTEEVAKYLAVCPNTVRKYFGEEATKVGRRVLYDIEKIERRLNEPKG